jgi:hypothetical protein
LNTPDLYAAIEAYFQMHIAVIDPDSGDPDGELAKRTSAKIKYIYDTMYPNMFDALKKKAQENGESTRRSSKAGPYASMLFELQDYSEAMAISYGLIEKPQAVEPQPSAPSTGGVPALPVPGMPQP